MSLKKPKIMAVDDEPRNLMILETIFDEDYEIVCAGSAKEAMAVLLNTVPEVILLDVMMPEMSGIELCQHLRLQKNLKHSKIIMVSGKSQLEERIEGYEAGADDYVVKPFDHEELEAKVRILSTLSKSQKALDELTESLEAEVESRTNEAIQNTRMAHIGMNSAQIVHNLRNPLTVLSGLLQLMARKYSEDEFFGKVLTATGRMDEIIKTILNQTKMGNDFEPIKCSVEKLLNDEISLKKMTPEFIKSYKVRFTSGEGTEVLAVPSHLSQIFGNVIKNAVEAMNESADKILDIESTIDGSDVVITISDSGSGIPSDSLEKIFATSYSTKGSSTEELSFGTGLGLAYCQRMLESYNGSISVKSTEGEGACFKIRIPKYCA